MKADDLILVSVDDHVVEPPAMFDQHVPAQWKTKAPRVVRKQDGSDVWIFNGQQVINIGLNAVVGRLPEEYGMEPTAYEQMRPGCWNIDERVRDMNVNGVLMSLCFPSFPGLCGGLFARQDDKNLARVMLNAYNDWHIDEWCGSYPGRFIPLALPALWDPQAAADEVRRVAAKGCHAVSFTEKPEDYQLPSVHSEAWDPFWQACVDTDTVICIHIGSGSGMKFTSMEAPVDVMITTTPMSIVSCAADLLWSRVLKKFPAIKIALSEGGIGWIPYFLERADYVHGHHKAWTYQDFGGLQPSDVWRRNIISCFIDDPIGVKNRHEIGIDTITWECDYPHSDTTWPKSPEALFAQLEGVSDEDIDKITHRNAIRFFSADPFAHRLREKCTAAALRAESPDVDTRPKSQTGGKPPVVGERRPVSTKDVVDQLSSAYMTMPDEAGQRR